MKQLRQILLWAVLVGIGLLLVLSVLGSFLGDERARVLFNSIPLVVFWVLLLGLLSAGLIYFKRLIHSAGLLGIHLGSLLILVGAMLGSDSGHSLAAMLFGSKKIPHGYMQIYEGQTSNRILDSKGKTEIGKLPFSVGLKDFRIDYYEVDEPWRLIVESALVDKESHKNKWLQEHIKWTEGQEVAIPFTQARLEVLQYLESARPTYTGDTRPLLEITQADGQKSTFTAEVGQELLLKDPQVRVEIMRIFSNLKVQGTGKGHKVINVPGPPKNPAVQVKLERAGGETTYQYVYAHGQVHGQEDDEFKLRYVFAEPDGAEPDPNTGLPAMEILIKYKDTSQRVWLIVHKNQTYARLPLIGLLGLEQKDDHGEHAHPRQLSLYLAKMQGQIKDYKSDLVVQEEGHIVDSKTIEVNDPLHYGGYHFYQSSYGSNKAGQWYTGLSVTSDTGLALVYIGFALMAGGMFWLFWFKPILVYLSKRRSDAS
ncbi:MAG: hypothetical protein GWP14_02505 [Actinobacteria bacterium]|nr:hypothetical protein [Actinomycetota bacterium]